MTPRRSVAQDGLPVPNPDYSSLQDEYVFPVQFDFIELDLVISNFFELVSRYGHLAKRLTSSSMASFDRFVDHLARHPFVHAVPERQPRIKIRDLINGWLLWNLVIPKRIGRARSKGNEMWYVRPITPGISRSGLPKQKSPYVRHADTWLYRATLDFHRLTTSPIDDTPRRGDIANLLLENSGVTIHGDPTNGEPRYDGGSEVDLNSRLIMQFLSSFTDAVDPECRLEHGESFPNEPWNAAKRSRSKYPTGILDQPVLEFDGPKFKHPLGALTLTPGAILPLGQAAVVLLRQFHRSGLTGQLSEQLAGLLGVLLLQAPIRVARALRQVIIDVNAPLSDDFNPLGRYDRSPGQLAENPCQMYCDFTNGLHPMSVEIARKCASRDLVLHNQLLKDRLLVRSLTMAHTFLGAVEREELRVLRSTSQVEYVRALLMRRESQSFSDAARIVFHDLRTTLAAGTEKDLELADLLGELELKFVEPFECLNEFLYESLGVRGEALENQRRLFGSVGGLRGDNDAKEYSLLAGNKKSDSWRYSPSDSLLLAMLNFAFSSEDGSRKREQMPLSELILVLRKRLGIFIDEAPEQLLSNETRLAALANREAFTRKLQVLGCFEGLSDDTDYQRVTRPRWGG